MNKKAQRLWAGRAVKAVVAAFQFEEHEIWSVGKRFFPHAQACTVLVEQWAFAFAEAALLLNQAASYLNICLANYQDALPLLERAVAICEQVLGPQHPDAATSLNNLALLYEDLGQYEDALPLLERALAILEEVIPQHPNTATARKSYADLLQKMQQGKQS